MSQNQKQEKQHTVEFEQCIQDVMKQGHEKGSAFAICTATFEKAKKPIYVDESESQKLHLFSESIKISERNKVSGLCIHPKRIFHPEEGVEHVYLREELEKAAPTLIGKPFGVDHRYMLPPPNVVTSSWYDSAEDGVAFEGVVDENVAEQIRNKVFKGISIELDWLRPGGKVEYMNGVAPKNFELSSVHLLRSFPPGDKEAFIKLWNGIMEQLVLGPPRTIDDRVDALESSFREMRTILEVVNGKLDVLSKNSPPLLVSGTTGTSGGAKLQVVIPIVEKRRASSGITGQGGMKEATWTAEYVNNLPDDAFAIILSGGQKDGQGKTTPRNLRKLEHHNAEGNPDADHVRNALAVLSGARGGVNAPQELKDRAKKHLCRHARDLDIKSEFCRLVESEESASLGNKLVGTESTLIGAAAGLAEAEKPKAEAMDVVALRKRVVNAEAKLLESEKQARAIREKYRRFREAVEGTHPVIGVQRSWSLGPQKMIAAQLRVLREFRE